MNFEFQNIVVDVDRDYYDYEKTATLYQKSFLNYIEKLEKMANRSLKEYEDFIVSFAPTLNFQTLDKIHDQFFGYGAPFVSIYDKDMFVEHFSCIPEEYEKRLKNAIEQISSKLSYLFSFQPEVEMIWREVEEANHEKFIDSYEKASEKNIKRHLKAHYDQIRKKKEEADFKEETREEALSKVMKNPMNRFLLSHLARIKENKVENFTTPFGIKLRKISYKILQQPLKIYTSLDLKKRKSDTKEKFSFSPYHNMVLENNYYPKLDKKKAYIFVPTHRYTEDVNSVLGHIDRNAYLLFGSSEQLQYNPESFAVWGWGMVYVDRLNTKSKQEAMKKLEYLLNHGTSVIIWVEGKYDNTENLLCGPIAESAYTLARKTGAEIVPVGTYLPDHKNQLITTFAPPIALGEIADKKKAQQILRDQLATLNYLALEKYSALQIRDEMKGDLHLQYMQERKKEYLKKPWYHDVWEEELHEVEEENDSPQMVRASLDKVLHNPISEAIPGPTLKKRREDQKYNFKNYMKKNWNK